MPVTPTKLRGPMMLVPGATSDGCCKASPKFPLEEYGASTPFWSVAPTLITHGAAAYGFSVPFPGPLLPAENTTLTPRSVSILVATLTGSFGSKTVAAEKLQLTTLTP